MRRLLAFVVAGGLVLALAAPAAAARPYVVKVYGMAGWTDTSIQVKAGDRIPMAANGFVTTAPISAHLSARISGSGPAGQVWGGACADSYQYVDTDEVGMCGVDSAYFGELVARDGVSGVLALAANDFMLTTFDNRGSFTVAFGG